MNAHPEFPCVTVPGYEFWVEAATVCNATHGGSGLYFCHDCTPQFQAKARRAGCCGHESLEEAMRELNRQRQAEGAKKRLITLDPDQIRTARRMHADGYRMTVIAARLGISLKVLQREIKGRLGDGR